MHIALAGSPRIAMIPKEQSSGRFGLKILSAGISCASRFDLSNLRWLNCNSKCNVIYRPISAKYATHFQSEDLTSYLIRITQRNVPHIPEPDASNDQDDQTNAPHVASADDFHAQDDEISVSSEDELDLIGPEDLLTRDGYDGSMLDT